MTERERQLVIYDMVMLTVRTWTACNPGQLKVVVARYRDSVALAYVQDGEVAHSSLMGYN